MANIKVGYMVEVDSWENDGDNNQTNTLNGLILEEVLFLKDFLPLFLSGNDDSETSLDAFGNTGEYNEANYFGLITRTRELLVKHNMQHIPEVAHLFDPSITALLDEYGDIGSFDQLPKEIKYEVRGDIETLIGGLLGYGEGYDFRVFDDMRVYFVPQEIVELDVKSLRKQ